LSDGSLEGYVGKVRELGVSARPVDKTAFASTIEGSDQILSAAMLQLRIAPTAELYRRVAERYRELRILDAAYDNYMRARQREPNDPVAYDGLARIWRDWGFPQRALGEATRSVYLGPYWPAAHNTLGTILAALGDYQEARRAYERALALEPDAAYVLNNLCYLSFVSGQLTDAASRCRQALDREPSLAAARNNLALVYMAEHRDDLARQTFMAGGDASAAFYNLGIARLADRRYKSASEAFEAANLQRPVWTAALERARDARARAASADTTAEAPTAGD
jgi:tetratricopeptide (TPR) repeat protein